MYGCMTTHNDSTKICTKCSVAKPITEYNRKGLRKNGTYRLQAYCRDCQSTWHKAHYKANPGPVKKATTARRQIYYKENRQIVDSIKRYLCCALCAESAPCALDFHHVDGDKEANIGNVLHCWSRKKLLLEIHKCEVLCVNCHRKYHAGIVALPQVKRNTVCI